MLFKFLGNSDAPDWVLSELNTLSLVSSVRVKFLLRQIFALLTGHGMDYDEISRHLTDAKLDDSQTRSVLAVLAFIIQNAVRFDVEPEDLTQELQQLGAPLSHSNTLTRFYRENRRKLRKYQKTQVQRMSIAKLIEYRSDVVLSRKDGINFPQGRVYLRFHPSYGDDFTFSMTSQQTDDLIRELKSAIQVMKSVK